MKKKYNCILLIDDDRVTNFIHERLLKSLDCAETIIAYNNAREALKFLFREKNGESHQPDLVFLDINMPEMNGWEFLEEYDKLEDKKKAKQVIVMVTTSLNPDDLERAQERNIGGFVNKPLSKVDLQKIIEENFKHID